MSEEPKATTSVLPSPNADIGFFCQPNLDLRSSLNDCAEIRNDLGTTSWVAECAEANLAIRNCSHPFSTEGHIFTSIKGGGDFTNLMRRAHQLIIRWTCAAGRDSTKISDGVGVLTLSEHQIDAGWGPCRAERGAINAQFGHRSFATQSASPSPTSIKTRRLFKSQFQEQNVRQMLRWWMWLLWLRLLWPMVRHSSFAFN